MLFRSFRFVIHSWLVLVVQFFLLNNIGQIVKSVNLSTGVVNDHQLSMHGMMFRSQGVPVLPGELSRSFVCKVLPLSIYKRLNVDRGALFLLLTPSGDAA